MMDMSERGRQTENWRKVERGIRGTASYEKEKWKKTGRETHEERWSKGQSKSGVFGRKRGL